MTLLSLFHRPIPRPTPAERRVLALTLCESGPVDSSELSQVFHWAAQRENSPTLDLVLEGLLAVEIDAAKVCFRLRTEKAPAWLGLGEGRDEV